MTRANTNQGSPQPFLLLFLRSEAGCQQFILQSSLTSTVLVWSSKATSALMTCKSWCHDLRAQTAHWCRSSVYLRGPLPPPAAAHSQLLREPLTEPMEKPTTCRRKGCKGEKSPQHPWKALWVLTRPVGIDFLKSHLLEMDQLRWAEEPYERKPQIKFSLPDEVWRTTGRIHRCWFFFFFLRWVRDRWELALYPSTSSLQPSARVPSHTIP